MSIFGSILSKIFPGAKAAEAPAPAPAAPADAPAPAVAAPPPAIPLGDVAAVLDAMPGSKNLNWRTSIVDLMKLLGLDSSLEARKQLAAELSYGEDTSDSAKMNIWLHRQVMTKLAANGGTVPAELRD
ncbi:MULTISPECIES: DUF3597 domain-containing protein [Variovorax]|jgi:hypothetical protein|uniref:DUF3597 domain-containing protein n=1 Tax=Variovorax guangxiensis TaxID=1775474 RepID=A0A433MGG7_9BURK|nr:MULTISPECIES: DUF3597 domain-containing protein [Variovorax]MBB3640918.1 hypothetical protein [Variovorax sp. BK613]MBB4222714.1 hypothetical protein [Variovorax guangxiensis]MDR6520368.1 hypothetical protein [Variovorax paradoxus]NVM89116.1 hypothetical protein [Variovorax sp. SG517]RTD92763.1 DUF3597 domain-containing protein [Variovorax sp. 369]